MAKETHEEIYKISFEVGKNPFSQILSDIDTLKASVNSLNASAVLDDLGKKASVAAAGTKELATGITSLRGGQQAMYGLLFDMQEFDSKTSGAKSALASFQKSMQTLRADPIEMIKDKLVAVQLQSAVVAGAFQTVAIRNFSNLTNNLKTVKGTLSEGETGAKGFTNILKNAGKVSVVRVGKGVQTVKTRLTEGVQKAKIFGTSLKNAAKTSFTKVAGGLKTVGSFIGGGVNGAKKAFNLVKTGFNKLPAPVTAGFTQGLVPDIQSVMGGLNSAFESGGLEGYLSAMPEAFGNIAGLIQTQIPAIAQDISSSFPTIFSTIAQTLPQILPVIIDSLLNVFSSLLNVLSSQGPSILTALISALNQAVQGLLAMLPQLITVGLQLIIALVQGLAMAAPTLIPAIMDAVMGMLNSLVAMLPQLIIAGLQLLLGLVQGIMNALPILVSMVPQIITNLVNGILANLPTILQLGVELLVQLALGLVQAIPMLLGAVPQIIQSLWDALTQINWLELGGKIIKGIGTGIVNGIKSIFGKGDKEKSSDSASFSAGMSAGTGNVAATASTLSNTAANSLGTGSVASMTQGMNVANSFGQGMNMNGAGLANTATQISGNTVAAFGASGGAYQQGADMVNTFSSGMTAQDPALQAQSISAEAQNALGAAKEAITVASDEIIAKLTQIKVSITEAMLACQVSIGENMAQSFMNLSLALTNVVMAFTMFQQAAMGAFLALTILGTVGVAIFTASVTMGFFTMLMTVTMIMAALIAVVAASMMALAVVSAAGVITLSAVASAAMLSFASIIAAGLAFSVGTMTMVVSAALVQMTLFAAAFGVACAAIGLLTTNCATQILEAFKKVNLLTTGMQMINGLILGMNARKEAAVATARAIAQAINTEYDKIQKISSPSKVWYEKGANMIQGGIGGMESQMPKMQSVAQQAGNMSMPYTGSYSPEQGAGAVTARSQSTEYNSYAPQFNMTISGSNDDRILARKVKAWIKSSMDEVFDSMARTNPRLREV